PLFPYVTRRQSTLRWIFSPASSISSPNPSAVFRQAETAATRPPIRNIRSTLLITRVIITVDLFYLRPACSVVRKQGPVTSSHTTSALISQRLSSSSRHGFPPRHASRLTPDRVRPRSCTDARFSIRP